MANTNQQNTGMMKKYLGKVYLPAMIGTTIEYYDIALYGYMAPILVSVFLPHIDVLSAYLYYFLFDVVASICQTAGGRFFGKTGDNYGRKKAMYYAMIGTSFITFCISIIPTYEQVGILAAIIFALCRALQGFFLGGEYNGGAIYCLEHEPDSTNHPLVSAVYCAMTALGILLAAIVATTIIYYGKEYFRIAYAISFFLAITTYYLRRSMRETPEYIKSKKANNIDKNSNVAGFVRPFIAIASVVIFFSILYGLPSRIFNAILPIATGISPVNIMIINTSLLALYIILILWFGWVAKKIGSAKLMRISSLTTLILAYPLITLIESKSIIIIICVKLIFTILTAALSAPTHAWMQRLFQTSSRYCSISTAYGFGKICSTLLLSYSVWLFNKHASLNALSVILMISALIAYIVLRFNYNQQNGANKL